jgi:hypothetical protein
MEAIFKFAASLIYYENNKKILEILKEVRNFFKRLLMFLQKKYNNGFR